MDKIFKYTSTTKNNLFKSINIYMQNEIPPVNSIVFRSVSIILFFSSRSEIKFSLSSIFFSSKSFWAASFSRKYSRSTLSFYKNKWLGKHKITEIGRKKSMWKKNLASSLKRKSWYYRLFTASPMVECHRWHKYLAERLFIWETNNIFWKRK